MDTETIYDSSQRRNPAIEEIINAFVYRDLILQLIRRDITTRYKRSVLGIAWTMLNPLGIMLILTFVFSNFFTRGQPYFAVYLLSGLLTWNFVSQTSSAIIQSLTWGQDLFQRIYLPRSSFAISAVGTGAVNLVLALIPLMLVKLVIGSPFSWQIVFFPIYIIYVTAFSLGIGLAIASFALYFPDIAEMYQVLLSGWFYLTPIIYPYDAQPENIKHLLALNPMLYIIQLMRDSFYLNVTPSAGDMLLVTAICFSTLVVGWLLFARQTEEFILRA